MDDQINEADLKATPLLPRDDEGPVFKAPWEAKAFAMTVDLHNRGIFQWSNWCKTLSAEIKAAQAAGDPDLGDTYYNHWLSALERMLTDSELTNEAQLAAVKEDWRMADEHRGFGEAPTYVKGAAQVAS